MGWHRKTFGELLDQDRPRHEHAIIVDAAHFAMEQLAHPEAPKFWPFEKLSRFALLLDDPVSSISVIEGDADVAVWWFTPDKGRPCNLVLV